MKIPQNQANREYNQNFHQTYHNQINLANTKPCENWFELKTLEIKTNDYDL